MYKYMARHDKIPGRNNLPTPLPSSGFNPRTLPPVAAECESITEGRGSKAKLHVTPPAGLKSYTDPLRALKISSMASLEVPNVSVAKSQFLSTKKSALATFVLFH